MFLDPGFTDAEAGIPLEVMWNDIDLYHAVRDFTTDNVSFPGEEVRGFIRGLVSAICFLFFVFWCCVLMWGLGGWDRNRIISIVSLVGVCER